MLLLMDVVVVEPFNCIRYAQTTSPARLYDDDDPEDLEVIKSCKGFLTRPNVDGPERATAAPGEKRTTRRK